MNIIKKRIASFMLALAIVVPFITPSTILCKNNLQTLSDRNTTPLISKKSRVAKTRDFLRKKIKRNEDSTWGMLIPEDTTWGDLITGASDQAAFLSIFFCQPLQYAFLTSKATTIALHHNAKEGARTWLREIVLAGIISGTYRKLVHDKIIVMPQSIEKRWWLNVPCCIGAQVAVAIPISIAGNYVMSKALDGAESFYNKHYKIPDQQEENSSASAA